MDLGLKSSRSRNESGKTKLTSVVGLMRESVERVDVSLIESGGQTEDGSATKTSRHREKKRQLTSK